VPVTLCLAVQVDWGELQEGRPETCPRCMVPATPVRNCKFEVSSRMHAWMRQARRALKR
jgi:hypothetical protein